MAKLRPNEKRIQLAFLRPEDLRLFDFIERESYKARYEPSTYILVALHEAFKAQLEEAEISTLAEEAARKVRERATTPVEVPHPIPVAPEPPPAPKVTLSDDEAHKQAEAQLAQLDAIQMTAMKKPKRGKGVPVPPPLPPLDSNNTG